MSAALVRGYQLQQGGTRLMRDFGPLRGKRGRATRTGGKHGPDGTAQARVVWLPAATSRGN
jgi:hypothetical protein